MPAADSLPLQPSGVAQQDFVIADLDQHRRQSLHIGIHRRHQRILYLVFAQ